jgi:hypothetical protein
MNNKALNWKMWESINLTPGLRLPNHLNLSDSIIEQVKRIDWKDLDWDNIGNDGRSIIWLDLISHRDLQIKEGVIVDIQLISDMFYQIHIALSESLRGIGLGTKIYRSIIDIYGHLYSGKGRRHNPIINRVWDKLSKDPNLICLDNEFATICINRTNPMKDQLIHGFNLLGDL